MSADVISVANTNTISIDDRSENLLRFDIISRIQEDDVTSIGMIIYEKKKKIDVCGAISLKILLKCDM